MLLVAGIALGTAAAAYLYTLHKKRRALATAAEPSGTLQLPVIDFNVFNARASSPAAGALYHAECAKVAEALHKYGICIVRDPRVLEADNSRFLDMMERYFFLSSGGAGRIRDQRPEYAFQIGVTPEGTERPRNHCARIGSMTPGNKPLSPCPPELDPKWRFFWRVGPVPKKTAFPALNADAVIPPEFPEWKEVMDMWGDKMCSALFVMAEMAATGFGMPEDAFTSRMVNGPHLLAPTGSDFSKVRARGMRGGLVVAR